MTQEKQDLPILLWISLLVDGNRSSIYDIGSSPFKFYSRRRTSGSDIGVVVMIAAAAAVVDPFPYPTPEAVPG